MPPVDEVTLVVEPPEPIFIGDTTMPFPEYAELGNLQSNLSTIMHEAAASSGRRIARADQLSGDTQALWAQSLNDTSERAFAYRTATESGSGSTRREVNLNPGSSANP